MKTHLIALTLVLTSLFSTSALAGKGGFDISGGKTQAPEPESDSGCLGPQLANGVLHALSALRNGN